MKERPIIFTENIPKILDGTKTQTRRLLKPQPPRIWDEQPYFINKIGSWCFHGHDGHGYKRCPYGQVGDRLWVKETWARCECGGCVCPKTIYKADGIEGYCGYWQPSIHMPRWAARITLEITKIRVERLQEISDADCIAEGCPSVLITLATVPMQGWYRHLWDSLNAKPKPHYIKGKVAFYESYPWEDIQETRSYRGKPWYVHGNPWVWPIDFRRV